MSGESAWMIWAAVALIAVIAAVGWWVWRKGRPFAEGDVYAASRLSSGNRLFPTQVMISPTSVVQYTPRWVGHREETIHLVHVASVKVDTGALFANVYIETSGGASPITCHGHRKRDAVEMKKLIERYQTSYYRATGAVDPGVSGR